MAKRQLEEQYAIVFVDATYFQCKTRWNCNKESSVYSIRSYHEWRERNLRIYIGDAESAKYWCNILNELRNRGVKDILILCADGLKGLKDAIGNIFPMTEFQRCIVHIIRNTLQYVSYKDRKELAKDLKQIYRASTEEIAYNNLMELEEKWKARRVSLDIWKDNWDSIQPFFKYGPETRKIMYTTNAIESLNNCYKKLNKGRRVFPTVQSLEKSMYLSTKIITEKWTSRYPNWGVTISELHTFFPDRFEIS